jgi:hypothetical protein
MPEKDPCREWLGKNGHDNIAELIDGFVSKWKAEGRRTRRNWWEILAGGRLGKPRTIDGQAFPVLKAAQIRQGLPVTANAISNSAERPPPRPRATGRWPKRRRKLNLVLAKNKKNVSKKPKASRVVGVFPRSA